MLTIDLTITDEDTEEETTHTVPARFEICTRCEGAGHHTNPSIDGNGISGEEFFGPDWDDESRETYMSGGYDVRCEAGCRDGKVLVPNPDAASAPQIEVIKAWEKAEETRARFDAEDRRTRYMESGGREGGWY